MAKGEAWTIDDEEKLVKLALEGQKIEVVARTLDRSVPATLSRLQQIVETRLQWERLCRALKGEDVADDQSKEP